MGKIPAEASAEIEKCAMEADWYAEHGPQMFADAPAATGKIEAYVSYLPLGPIHAIMPWNLPFLAGDTHGDSNDPGGQCSPSKALTQHAKEFARMRAGDA
jgi:hypothetical protein